MNSSEKNYHFKQLIQLKVGVGPESELESDNRNCQESETGLPTPQPCFAQMKASVELCINKLSDVAAKANCEKSESELGEL